MDMTFRLRTALVVLVLLAGACSSSVSDGGVVVSEESGDSSASPEAPGAPMRNVSVAALGTIDSSPVWVAVSRGFFDELGIEVDFLPASELSDVTNLLLDGSAEVVALPSAAVVRLASEGEPVRIVHYLNSTSGDATRHSMTLVQGASQGLETGCDLVGKRVGVDTKDSLVTLAIREMVSNDGCNPARVSLVSASLGDQLDLLDEGDVDAIGLFEPYTARANRREFSQVANLDRELCPGLQRCPVGILATTDAWGDENSELLADFNVAVGRAMLWMESNETPYRASLMECCGITADDAADIRVADWVGNVAALEADLTRLIDVMDRQNELTRRPDIAELLS